MTPNPASQAASALGKIKSPAKAAASRANGRKGGRPSKKAMREELERCRPQMERMPPIALTCTTREQAERLAREHLERR